MMFYPTNYHWVFNTTGETLYVKHLKVPPGQYLDQSIFPAEAVILRDLVKKWHLEHVYNNTDHEIYIPKYQYTFRQGAYVSRSIISADLVGLIEHELQQMNACKVHLGHEAIGRSGHDENSQPERPNRTCQCGAWSVKDEIHSNWCPDYE